MTIKIDMSPTLQPAGAVNGFVRSTDQPNTLKVDQTIKADLNELTVEHLSGNKFSTEKVDKTDKISSLNQKAEVDQAKDLGKEELNKVVTDLNSSIQNVQRNLAFSVDDNSGQIVINVTDKESGDILRQIPSEDVLKMAGKLQEMINSRRENISASAEGLFVKTSA